MKTVLLFAILVAHSICFAEPSIYKHFGDRGETIYSDHHLKGAEQAELPALTVLPASQRLSKALPSIAQMEADDSLQHNETGQIGTHQSGVIPSAKSEKVMQPTEISANQTDKVELSPEEQLQLIIDDMELYDDDIDRLELELYKIGADY